jgi:hypothetical protein
MYGTHCLKKCVHDGDIKVKVCRSQVLLNYENIKVFFGKCGVSFSSQITVAVGILNPFRLSVKSQIINL